MRFENTPPPIIWTVMIAKLLYSFQNPLLLRGEIIECLRCSNNLTTSEDDNGRAE